MNHVVLVGTLSRYGVTLEYATSGASCASFTLVLGEVAQDGKEYTTLVPCEVWGKKAEAASELEPGALVLFEGKLTRRKHGKQWAMVVTGFDVTPIITGAGNLTGSAN